MYLILIVIVLFLVWLLLDSFVKSNPKIMAGFMKSSKMVCPQRGFNYLEHLAVIHWQSLSFMGRAVCIFALDEALIFRSGNIFCQLFYPQQNA